MANPVAGETWTCNVTSLETDDDVYVYFVEDVVTNSESVDYALVKQLGPEAGGFRKRVRADYMGAASSPWTKDAAAPAP